MNRPLVLVMRNPAFDTALVAPHRAYLAALRDEGRIELAGGFADRSGGACPLRAAAVEEALALALRDPLHASGASAVTVREWIAA